MILKHEPNKLFCFSPPVMIATFIIEVALAIYVIFRYKMNEVGRLSVLMLLFLATFQLAEFMVCGATAGSSMTWSRIGYVAITTLPPLGLHLIYALGGAKGGVKNRPLLIPAYLSGIAFAAFFMFAPSAFDGHVCLGNYVIFEVAKGFGGAFGAYYYVWLAATLLLGWWFMKRATRARQRRALTGLMLGYSIFIIPAVTANLVSPEVIRGMPSVMCGFAVLLALALVFIALPNFSEAEAAGDKKT